VWPLISLTLVATQTFIPKSNEGKEHDSIAQMGKRLAFEVVQYCKGRTSVYTRSTPLDIYRKCLRRLRCVAEYHPELLQPGTKPRISFIGHSMGGLIVRQALQVRFGWCVIFWALQHSMG
jgi:hypothetical protein